MPRVPAPPPQPTPIAPHLSRTEKATTEGHRGRRRGSGQGTEVWGPVPTCGDGPKYLGPTAERERNPTPQPGGGRKRSRGEGGSSGGREVARQAARPAAADPWSVNKPSGPTLPQPRACPRIGKAQDGSVEGPDLAASPLLACDAYPGVAGGRPGRPSGLGAIRERGARAGRGRAARGLQRGVLPGPGYLAAAVALPPAPAPPPRPTVGARRQRRRQRLPEQPAATSRARPLSASLRAAARPAAAASALSPQSGHGHRGPARDSRCRRRGQRGGEQARRRGDTGGEGGERRGGGLGSSGLLMAAVRGPGAKKTPRQAAQRQGQTPPLVAVSLAPRPPAAQPMVGRLFPGAEGGPRKGDVTPAPGPDCEAAARAGPWVPPPVRRPVGWGCGTSATCGARREATARRARGTGTQPGRAGGGSCGCPAPSARSRLLLQPTSKSTPSLTK